MKLNGKELKGRNIVPIFIDKGTAEDSFELFAGATSMADFEKFCPDPEVPIKVVAGEGQVPFLEKPSYKAAVEKHNEQRMAYIVINSLKATEGLEWGTVDFEDCETWLGWKDDLEKAQFSPGEIMSIQMGALRANSLDPNQLKEAHDDFLAGKRLQETQGN